MAATLWLFIMLENTTPKLEIAHIGPIQKAVIEFGDLTVFIGPQASGKSIVLQLFKLLFDVGHIQAELQRHGSDWQGRLEGFLDLYFGEGMHRIWSAESRVIWQGKPVDFEGLAKRKHKIKNEAMFFIPAQRVLALREGWPRPFTDYSPGDPYAVREFSEKLRLLMDQEVFASEKLFPLKNRLKSAYQGLLRDHIFATLELQVDRLRSQKRLVLGEEGTAPLPYMVWSAGQREFVPLLLGLYWLLPIGSKSRQRTGIEWVLIEELEMGLHPRAISVLLLLVLELMSRGYKVCLSTHSSQILDMVWTLRHCLESKASPERLLELFSLDQSPSLCAMLSHLTEKQLRVFYFDKSMGNVSDISQLDPCANDVHEANWGGLMDFSTRANDLVARLVANADTGVVK